MCLSDRSINSRFSERGAGAYAELHRVICKDVDYILPEVCTYRSTIVVVTQLFRPVCIRQLDRNVKRLFKLV